MNNGAQVEFIGNVVQDDLERLYAANSNSAYTRMTVAVNTYSRAQEQETQYFRVTLWGRLADSALNRCQRGTQVFVRGQQRIRTYTRQDGTTGVSAEVAANELSVLNRARGAAQPAAEGQTGPEPDPEPQTGADTGRQQTAQQETGSSRANAAGPEAGGQEAGRQEAGRQEAGQQGDGYETDEPGMDDDDFEEIVDYDSFG